MAADSEKLWYLQPRGIDRERFGGGPHTLADIELDSLQQAQVLEWFAFKIWVAQNEGGGDKDYGGKSYDPLTVELESWGGGTPTATCSISKTAAAIIRFTRSRNWKSD